jgi:hypothetical protein
MRANMTTRNIDLSPWTLSIGSSDRVIHKLVSIWKESVATWSRYYPRMFLEGLRKTKKTLVTVGSVVAECRARALLLLDRLDRPFRCVPVLSYWTGMPMSFNNSRNTSSATLTLPPYSQCTNCKLRNNPEIEHISVSVWYPCFITYNLRLV